MFTQIRLGQRACCWSPPPPPPPAMYPIDFSPVSPWSSSSLVTKYSASTIVTGHHHHHRRRRCPMRLDSFRGNQLNDMSCQCILDHPLCVLALSPPLKGYLSPPPTKQLQQQQNVRQSLCGLLASPPSTHFGGHKSTSHPKMLLCVHNLSTQVM